MPSDDEIYRQFCRELVGMGVDQKKIGERADYESPNSWASKFLSGQIGSLKNEKARNLDRYFEELADLLSRRPRPLTTRHAKAPPVSKRKAG